MKTEEWTCPVCEERKLFEEVKSVLEDHFACEGCGFNIFEEDQLEINRVSIDLSELSDLPSQILLGRLTHKAMFELTPSRKPMNLKVTEVRSGFMIWILIDEEWIDSEFIPINLDGSLDITPL